MNHMNPTLAEAAIAPSRTHVSATAYPARYVVAVDIDGVLYEFVDVLRQWRHRTYGIPLAQMPDPGIYDIEAAWGMEPGSLVADMIQGVKDGVIFWQGEAHEAGLRGIRALREAGHHIVLITSRALPGIEELCRKATEAWLASKGVEYDDLILASDKTTIEWHILIDDYEKNVRAGHDAGRHAVLLNRYWNATVPMQQAHWDDIPALVAAAQAGSCDWVCCWN